MKIRDRIKELRRVKASELIPNPRNWRTHPKQQMDALRGILAEVGFAGAELARELSDGSLQLIDGHARAEIAGDAKIPVLILDVTESEANKILATFDPLGAMAEADASKLDDLLREVQTGNQALANMLAELAKENDLIDFSKDDPSEEDDSDTDSSSSDPPPSGVRMVQLFLDETNINEFHDACEALSAEYGTDSLTDTVFEAVKRANLTLQSKK